MDGIIFGFYAFSVVFIFGAIYHMMSLKKPGFFPPKKTLKKRALFLLISGLICIFLAIILTKFK